MLYFTPRLRCSFESDPETHVDLICSLVKIFHATFVPDQRCLCPTRCLGGLIIDWAESQDSQPAEQQGWCWSGRTPSYLSNLQSMASNCFPDVWLLTHPADPEADPSSPSAPFSTLYMRSSQSKMGKSHCKTLSDMEEML